MASEAETRAEAGEAPSLTPDRLQEQIRQARRRGRDDGLEPGLSWIGPAEEREAARTAPDGAAAAVQAPPGGKRSEAGRKPSLALGDVPEPLLRRYYVEPRRFGSELAFSMDAKAKEPAFRDVGGALVTRATDTQVIRDMVTIAAHRGWSAIQARGDADFKREVWLAAKSQGLEVRGYKPSERDQQELDRRRGPGSDRERGEPLEPLKSRRTAAPADSRVDFEKGFTGKLIEVGSAPYQNRPGQEMSPFARVELPGGKVQQVWGVSLPEGLAKAGVAVGDSVHVRRDGKETVLTMVEVRDRASGETTVQQRAVTRNRWAVEADRFREATPAEAARDPALKDAQSRLAVVKAVLQDRLKDPLALNRVLAAAKDRIADHMSSGGKVAPAVVRDPGRTAEPAERKPETPEVERAEGRVSRERTR